MSSLLEDLDDLMMPYRCEFSNALTPNEWIDWYKWMNENCKPGSWWIENNIVRFSNEENLILFVLRWT